jgi:hypothetical protein
MGLEYIGEYEYIVPDCLRIPPFTIQIKYIFSYLKVTFLVQKAKKRKRGKGNIPSANAEGA